MKKVYLFGVVLLSIIFLTVGCGSGKIKGADYLFNKDQMKEMTAQMKRESGGEKLVGSIIFSVNHFSAKGVKVDGSANFWTVDSKNSTKTVRHLFSSPDKWDTVPGGLVSNDPVWEMDVERLERIPELIKDAGDQLAAQKNITGEVRMDAVIVDPERITITYRGEKQGAEYIVEGKSTTGKLIIKK